MKKLSKSKLVLSIGTALFLLVGIVAMLIGFSMTGWSIVDWLQSPYALTAFVILGLGSLFVFVIWLTYKRCHLGDE
jgi:hypothetical protein